MRASLTKAVPFVPLGFLWFYGPVSFDPGSTEPFGYFKQYVAFLCALGLLLSLLVGWWFSPATIHSTRPSAITGAVTLISVLAVSVLHAYNKTEALYEANRVLLMLGLFWSAAHLRWNPRVLRIFLWIALLPALWIALTVIMEYTGHLDAFGVQVVFYRKEQRVLAFFGHNNIIAQYLLAAACTSLGLMWSSTRAKELLALIPVTAFLLTGLFFTFCRSSWLGFLVGLAAMSWLSRRTGHKPYYTIWKYVLTVLILCAVGVGWVKSISPSPDSQGFVASQWKEAGIFHHISSGRIQMWLASIRMFLDNPLLGVGTGNYWVFYGRYDPARWDFVRMAHNDYLQFLCEYGLLGAGVMLGLFFLFCRWIFPRLLGAASAHWEICVPFIVPLIGALVDTFFSYDLQQNIPAALFACGAGILVSLLRKEEAPTQFLPRGLGILATASVLFVLLTEGFVLTQYWMADRANSRSIILEHEGDIRRAIGESRLALDFRSGFASYHNRLAVLCHQAGELEPALRNYEEARDLTPYEMPNYFGILSVLKQRNDTNELLEWYPATLDAAPHRSDIRNEYAALLFAKGSYKEAATQYEEILAYRPEDPLALFNLGNTCLRLPDFPRALFLFRKLSEMPPGKVGGSESGSRDAANDIAHGLAISLDGIGRTEQAYQVLKTWQEQYPTNIWSYLTELDIAVAHQDIQRVRTAAAKARHVDPKVVFTPTVESLLK